MRVTGNGTVESVILSNDIWYLDATFSVLSDRCPSCHNLLVRHGWTNAVFLDAPIDDMPVKLRVRRPRMKCPTCNKTLTPMVPGMVEGTRVTDRLVEYVQSHLWGAESLRRLAKEVGCAPKTVTDLLQGLADETRAQVVCPTRVGIHELRLNQKRYIILSDLDTALIVDFISEGAEQYRGVHDRLTRFACLQPLQELLVPLDLPLVREIASAHSAAHIGFSMSSFHHIVASGVANVACAESKKGRQGSVSCEEAKQIAARRVDELSSHHRVRVTRGILENHDFWNLFGAKEDLLKDLETRKGEEWLGCTRSWLSGLPEYWQPSFLPALAILSEVQSLGVTLTLNPALSTIEHNVATLRDLLVKPGRNFTAEMMATLVLASPLMSVLVEKRISRKGTGPLWVEEPWERDYPWEPTIRGISLEGLLSFLLVYWR